MATEFAMLDIMNAALVAEGYDEMAALNDGSVEWRLLSRNWPLIVEAELEDGNYHFTKTEVELTTPAAGKFGYDWAYLVPLAALHVRRAWTIDDSGNRDLTLEWAQDGANLYTDEDTSVWIDYAVVADEALWSANFARGVQMKLQAILLTYREERSAAIQMEQMADTYFQRARTNSSRGRSATQPYRRSRYAAARFGGSYFLEE